MTQRIPYINILGVPVSAVDMQLAVEKIESWIQNQERQYICVSTVNNLTECQRDQAFRTIHNRAGMVVPDGMPLVWLSQWKGARHVRRVYGPDLMLAVAELSVEKPTAITFMVEQKVLLKPLLIN
jgi:N-acetylglucosaminyldiphosphoundecaprenol N-acetyl-beta-D-mannosaminyltransferase